MEEVEHMLVSIYAPNSGIYVFHDITEKLFYNSGFPFTYNNLQVHKPS